MKKVNSISGRGHVVFLQAFAAASLVCAWGLLAAEARGALIADPAADWVAYNGSNLASIGGGANGWSYWGSNQQNGGTEFALTAKGIGNVGATGFGTSFGNSVPSVLGDNFNGGDYEIFGDGETNGGIVGQDILLHPGTAGDSAPFVIVRWTSNVNGSVNIAGSFRELAAPASGSHNSVDVFVYHNSTQLFSYDTPASGVNTLSQANGTFNVANLSISPGDKIDFVVGWNGHLSGDETALRAAITLVPEPASGAFAFLGLALAAARRKRQTPKRSGDAPATRL